MEPSCLHVDDDLLACRDLAHTFSAATLVRSWRQRALPCTLSGAGISCRRGIIDRHRSCPAPRADTLNRVAEWTEISHRRCRMLRTALCERLGIEHPIIQAPMVAA